MVGGSENVLRSQLWPHYKHSLWNNFIIPICMVGGSENVRSKGSPSRRLHDDQLDQPGDCHLHPDSNKYREVYKITERYQQN